MKTAPSIDELLAHIPQLGEYTVAPPALAPLPNVRELEHYLRAAIAAAPDDARGYAMLGNLLVRRSLYLQARDAYVRAAELDPSFAHAHLAAAELSTLARDPDAIATHLDCALRLRRRYDDPLPAGNRTQVLMLLKDAPYAVNAPLEVLFDRTRVALHKLYIGEEPHEEPPPHDVAFVAFGATQGDDDIAARAGTLSQDNRINNPALIRRCARETLSATLRDIPGVTTVESRRVGADEIGDVSLPALVRPVDTHAGYGLARIETAVELEQHVARFPSDGYDVSRFIEYRSDDGCYRKYRMIVVDGVAYPYHLAISPRWMVHYLSSPMAEHEWMREEERAYLSDPAHVFPSWGETTRAIARAVGLDYVGLDVTRLAGGSMLVFEADPAMLVHDEEPESRFAYKRPFVGAIREALHALIDDRRKA